MRVLAGRKLVIVESPAKIKNISAYLGPEYDVEASIGHIRDIPTPSELPPEMKKGPFGKFGVDVDNDFEPYYIVDADKRKKVADLKRLLKGADELYLATDEDREGEAIAWHLYEALQPKVPVKRMVFNEITREAIQRAVANTRDIDKDLVDAQETRRILDRLYGYEVSPVLWRKVRAGLSAGRVQSVATRMVVERERERMAFRSASYWDVDADFATSGSEVFEARLTGLDGSRVATGRDFGDDGSLRSAKVVHLDEPAARAIADGMPAAAIAVSSVQDKPYTRRPSAPFITSTLQQEASRKLRLSAADAMRVAQRLYENGYITYMRTDSTVLSASAINAARTQAREMYGAAYVPDEPRRYKSSNAGAQEAHEAIRPAGDTFRTPAQVSGQLRGTEFALYELIWKRTVASQMADAVGTTATVKVGAMLADGRVAEFSASGTVITFRGFLAAYEEGQDEEQRRGKKQSKLAEQEERRLPALVAGDVLRAQRVDAEGHATSPPPRYTEATLVKALEEKRIGRPSTYASTLGTIQDRGYVSSHGSALVPSWLAFAVTRLMEEHFARLVDYDFTAALEADLDEIARGDGRRVEWLRRFYFGDEATSADGLRDLVADLGDIDARAISTIDIGEGLVVRVGRYGPYVEEAPTGAPAPSPSNGGEGPSANGDGFPTGASASAGEPTTEVAVPARRASLNDDIAPADLTPERARELLAVSADDGRELGVDPATGRSVIAKAGRFGPYVTEVLPPTAGDIPATRKSAAPKPRTASLFKDMDLSTIDLDTALQLLSLPRVVGAHPETGAEITAQNGRYGPYLKMGTDSRSLEAEAQLFDVGLDEALAIYAEPKRHGRAAAKPPLRELGQDPVSGKPVTVKDGRFGAYVTDGETNATLRRDDDPETITPERGFELLADKRAAGPSTRRGAKKTARKTTKKTTKRATKATLK